MQTKTKRMFHLALLISITLFAVIIYGAGAIIRASARGRTHTDAETIPHRDVGLVLGCSRLLSDGRPNLFFVHRISAAAELHKAGKVNVLIVSGDNSQAAYDEPTDMKNALIAAGFPAEKIFCDYAGFRTLDSVVRAKHIFGQESITVISQRFHNQRAIYLARKHGIDAIGFNAPEVVYRHSFKTKLREQLSRVVAVLDVWFGKRPKFLGERVEVGVGKMDCNKMGTFT